MKLAPSCVPLPMLIADRPYQRIPHAALAHGPCDGCGVKPGGIHHMGCDLERCPRCHGQLIMCECSEAEAS